MVRESIKDAFTARKEVSNEVLSIYIKALMEHKKIANNTPYIDIVRNIKTEFGVFVSLKRIENYFDPDIVTEATDLKLQFENLGIK